MGWKPVEDRFDGHAAAPDGALTLRDSAGYVRTEGGGTLHGAPGGPSVSRIDLPEAGRTDGDLLRFYECSATACLTLAPDGHIRRLNPAAARLLGGTREALCGRDFAHCLAVEHRRAFDYFLTALFAHGRVGPGEFALMPSPAGRSSSVRADAILGAGARHCLLQLTDLTERRHMSETLMEAEAFSIGVLNSLAAHIAVLDPDGVIRAVNTAWQRFALESGSQALALGAVGQSYRAACELPAEDPDARQARLAWEGIASVIEGRAERFSMEYVCEAPERTRWFQLSAYPLVAPQRGVVVAHEDISARKWAEASLQQARLAAERANNAKSRLLAAVSHDLRQPLSALGLYVGLLEHRCDGGEAMLIRSMKDCVASLSALLTDVINLSKLESGVLQPTVRDFPVDELLARVVSVNAAEAMLKRLALRRAACPANLCARTDPVLFARILDNLVSNAVRYTESGAVLVGCRRFGGKRWVEVWDSGVGIAEHSLQEIFDEYRQLDNADRIHGSGLGLAIVEKLARLLGLQIRVASRPGRGSMFAVELPPGRATHAAGLAPPPLRKLRVALVEDNPDACRRIGDALREVGHRVLIAPGGAELLALLDGSAPDVVVADYRLRREESGFEAIETVRKAYGEHLPAVILADHIQPGIMRSMADRGIVVQRKPAELERLVLSIAQLTERRMG